MNAFMSLVATFLLDLTQWSSFIATTAAEMINSLYTVRLLKILTFSLSDDGHVGENHSARHHFQV